jgi:hypothetical protein
VIALTIVLICLGGFAAVRAVHAEAPPTGTLTAVPTDGKPRGLQLRSQTVDATIRQTSDGMLADTVLWVKFSNPGKQTVVMPLALGGPQLGPRALPQILDVALDNKPVALETLEPFTARVDGGPVIAYTLPITVPLKGSATLRVRYNQVLAEQEGLISYTYPITATARWSGAPESLRVTVKFDPSLPADQILSRTPAALRVARDGITWAWDAQRPKTSVGASFISPAWWRDYTAARTAAAAPDAGPTEHLALSRFYRRLSELPPPAFDSATDYYSRYFPSEVAELQAALAASERGSSTEVSAIHLRLAEIYLAHSERLGLGSNSAYLQSAATELAAAIALDNTDATVRSTASSLYAQLAQAAAARGDQMTAAQHLARVAALDATGSIAPTEVLAQATILVRANEALARGDLRAARQLVAEGFGAGAVTRAGAPPSRAGQTLATVATAAGERAITLRLVGSDLSAISALLADTASALAGTPAVSVSTAGDHIRITIPYTDSRKLAAVQLKLAAALPDEPELALLGAVLSPHQLAWEQRSRLLGSSERYVERIDLGPAWQAWETRANRLEAASLGQDETGTTAPELALLQRAFWAADAAAWRKLAAESQVDYRARIAADEPERHWAAAAGATRVLEAETRSLMPAQIALVAGVAVCLLVAFVLAAWLLI